MESFETVINGQEVTVEYEYTYYYEDDTCFEDINITNVNAYTEEGACEVDYELIYKDIYGKRSLENL